ncbi:MAG TPA: hypothetical protein VI757_02155 [Bacteroidia bacterium]|nr:hypothetical protein [Bacteroidia bacterium]
MTNSFRNFISRLFHPLYMPLAGCAFVFYAFPSQIFLMQKFHLIMLAAILLLNTIIIPGIASLVLTRKRIITSLEMNEANERRIPIIIISVCYIISCYMVRVFCPYKFFYLIMLGAAAAAFVALIINYRWKISMHMMGMGGVTGIIAALMSTASNDISLLLMLQIILSGVIGSVRLAGHHHSGEQIYYGFALGFFCEYLMLSL